jgi:hypothetical protein
MSAYERFIKFIPSEKADWLREEHPYAFLLLSLIAQRARRCPGHPDGLEVGDALIGDYDKAGIPTEAKYRSAKSILVKIGAIKIKETNRNPISKEANKRILTNRTTTRGTLVTLLNSDVWDINRVLPHDPNNEYSTNKQRFSDDEQEGKKKKEKVKKESSPKSQKKEKSFAPNNCFKF